MKFGKLTKCPVCQKKLLTQAVRNHIINSAEGEAFISLINLIRASRNKPYQFSPIVLLRNKGHLKYYLKNYNLTGNRKLCLEK